VHLVGLFLARFVIHHASRSGGLAVAGLKSVPILLSKVFLLSVINFGCLGVVC